MGVGVGVGVYVTHTTRPAMQMMGKFPRKNTKKKATCMLMTPSCVSTRSRGNGSIHPSKGLLVPQIRTSTHNDARTHPHSRPQRQNSHASMARHEPGTTLHGTGRTPLRCCLRTPSASPRRTHMGPSMAMVPMVRYMQTVGMSRSHSPMGDARSAAPNPFCTAQYCSFQQMPWRLDTQLRRYSVVTTAQ